MSKDLNQCNFIGRLGKDVDTKYTVSGSAVANISIACSDDYKDKNTGEKISKTNWINIVMFGKLAEISAQYLTKGSQVFISGMFVTRKWQDKGGTDHYSTEIIANNMQMLGGKPGGSSGQFPSNQQGQFPETHPNQTAGVPEQAHAPSQSQPVDDGFDDIPF